MNENQLNQQVPESKPAITTNTEAGSELQVETLKTFTLYKGTKREEMVVSNTDEAIKAILDGFYFRNTPWHKDTPEVKDFESTFNINIRQVRRDKDLKTINEMFLENEHRELLYLSEGLDKWFEDVNSYFYNRNYLEYDKKIWTEFPPESLERKLLNAIDFGKSGILHQDPKDISAKIEYYRDFNSEIEKKPEIPEGFLLDTDTLQENCVSDMLRMAEGRILWKNKKIPDRLLPNEEGIKEYHPLLKHFDKIIDKLKAEGATELPSWLIEQGEMAGVSAVYKDYPILLKDWVDKERKRVDDYEDYIKKNNIQNAPHVSLPIEYLEDIMIIDEKIHRRNS
jgi:hypothetical protein